MASSSGNSSGMTRNIPSSGSEDDLMLLMDQRKRKRMESNRESAKRSRMRKQKHLDEMTTTLVRLRAANGEILARIGVTAQHLAKVEAENAVLWAQMAELGQRLESLNEILNFINMGNNVNIGGLELEDYYYNSANFMISSMGNNVMGRIVNQPIIAASSDVFDY